MQKIIRVESGNRSDKRKLNNLLAEGWHIKSQSNQGQGYSGSKTCCFGCLFLPLALLGKKNDVMEYVLEKEESKALENIKNNKKENENERGSKN